MKTRCPHCQTSFRVTPEQLKARAGKVRCGQCQAVFNALDSLLEEVRVPPRSTKYDPTDSVVDGESLMPLDFDFSPIDAGYPPPAAATVEKTSEKGPEVAPEEAPTPAPTEARLDADTQPPPDGLAIDTAPPPSSLEPESALAPEPAREIEAEPLAEPAPERLAEPVPETAPQREPELAAKADTDTEPGWDESEARELGEANGLIAPRETTRIPGYSKWSEELIAGPLAPPEQPARWPFFVVALILVVTLVGQVAFRFRSELAVTTPALRPALAAWASLFDADIPLPRHVELVSIEASDLQKDAARGNLLVLNATLKNRAGYSQAYPALELSLTDTEDKAIARRVFAPAEYLSPKLKPGEPFKANSEVAVRLWIEAKDIAAAGYRLYVFYP